MKVTRFMSREEWDKLKAGQTITNHRKHKAKTTSVGFCFTEDEPQVAWEYLGGVVDADVCVTFDFPDGYLRKSRGIYADHSEGADFFDKVIKTEWCCEEYSNEVAQVVKICNPFQGEEYAKLKMLAKIFKQRLYE